MIDERFVATSLRLDPPRDAFERLRRRRDRKRRNQRIAAGVLGIVVFVAAIWIVTSGLPFDRTRTTPVPGGSGTGPAVTGPTVTGPSFDPSLDYVGLPPVGAEPSSPEKGKLVDGFHEIHAGWVYVYADGRVISWSEGLSASPEPAGFREQRLTPEGVELVRSGDLKPADLFLRPDEVPASAWEDPTMWPYVPSRYAICAYQNEEGRVGIVGDFPTAARDLLVGKERTFDVSGPGQQGEGECFDVTTEEAQALDEILSDAGFWTPRPPYGRHSRVSPDSDPVNWVLWVQFQPVLPHGTFADQPG